MAKRPVFLTQKTAPYSFTCPIDLEWHGGFAVSQKQKNIVALHEGIALRYPGRPVLEISSKSMQGGEQVSAFFLPKFVPSLGRSVPLECVFQASKVFGDKGPFTDLLEKTPREAKRDERLKSSGPLTGFRFEGVDYPAQPTTAFYDWLYISALLENPEQAAFLMQFDAFTDIEFNPNKSLNCQANAAARFVSLNRQGLLTGDWADKYIFCRK